MPITLLSLPSTEELVMRLRPLPLAGLLLTMAASCIFAEEPASEEPASNKISGIGPVGAVEKVHGDLRFTEGPTWIPGDGLYFTDIPADRIYRTDGTNLEVFVEPSGHCNGLMYAGGRLYACSMDGALVAFDEQGNKTVLAPKYNGKRFNAPNDLVVDQAGGVYFTDPRFRAPEPWPQGIEAVYYWSPEGSVTRIIDDLNKEAPNGVILTPDEKTLYVCCSMQDEIMQYPVLSPGKIGEGTLFAKIKQPEGVSESGGDGMTIDTKGNLYVCTALGVQVFSPEGDTLGVISLPEQPANATFGGPEMKTLYVTARTGLYAVPMAATGHVFPGPQQTKPQ